MDQNLVRYGGDDGDAAALIAVAAQEREQEQGQEQEQKCQSRIVRDIDGWNVGEPFGKKAEEGGEWSDGRGSREDDEEDVVREGDELLFFGHQERLQQQSIQEEQERQKSMVREVESFYDGLKWMGSNCLLCIRYGRSYVKHRFQSSSRCQFMGFRPHSATSATSVKSRTGLEIFAVRKRLDEEEKLQKLRQIIARYEEEKARLYRMI